MSRVLVIVLCVAGALLLGVAAVGAWAQAVLVDEEGFTAVAVETMRTPAVSARLAASIVDALDGAYGIAEYVERDRADQVFANVLRRSSSIPLLTGIAQSVHRGLFTPGGGDVGLSFAESAPVFEEALAEIDPLLVSFLPEPEKMEDVTLIPADELPGLSAGGRLVPWAAALAAIVGVLFLAFGVWMAYPREAALSAGGLGLAMGGAALVAAVLVTPSVGGGIVLDPLLEQVAREGIGEISGGLFVVGAAAFVIGIAAMTLAGRRKRRPAGRDARGVTSRRR